MNVQRVDQEKGLKRLGDEDQTLSDDLANRKIKSYKIKVCRQKINQSKGLKRLVNEEK